MSIQVVDIQSHDKVMLINHVSTLSFLIFNLSWRCFHDNFDSEFGNYFVPHGENQWKIHYDQEVHISTLLARYLQIGMNVLTHSSVSKHRMFQYKQTPMTVGCWCWRYLNHSTWLYPPPALQTTIPYLCIHVNSAHTALKISDTNQSHRRKM